MNGDFTDPHLRALIVIVPLYSDDTDYAYHIRLARAVLAAERARKCDHSKKERVEQAIYNFGRACANERVWAGNSFAALPEFNALIDEIYSKGHG